MIEQEPSRRLEELIRERARLDVELERCKELVTVLFVDIVGSTSFYDEHGDVAGLVMVQKCLDLLTPLVQHYSGTVIKTIGDAILARFFDVEGAVRCAVAMQRNLAERNRDKVPADEIHVRVAVNVGLALLKGNDVFGDVVNVTSRIEGVTDADEIAISPSVYEKIRHLHDIRVRKKASGVELKGKAGCLDLYTIVWRVDESAGPAPPRPSREQLAFATGLHTNLAERVQRRIRSRGGRVSPQDVAVSIETRSPDETAVLGAPEVEGLSQGAIRFVLARVRADGSLGQQYPLDHPSVIAGCEEVLESSRGEISLADDPQVAPQHARLTQLGDIVDIEDLGSPLGLYLCLREPHQLKDGDIFQIGQQRLRFAARQKDVAHVNHVSRDHTMIFGADGEAAEVASVIKLNSKNEEADHYDLHFPETSFGRSKGTYTFPDDPYLSATHARIKLHEKDYFLEDLGSRNGTFARIRKRAQARDGDTLMIGKQLLRVLSERVGTVEIERD
jgi:class 3 adenylate cyclase/pSer/pThr/pTyr-binding forkhead associated (FHA) protein